MLSVYLDVLRVEQQIIAPDITVMGVVGFSCSQSINLSIKQLVRISTWSRIVTCCCVFMYECG